MSDDTQWTPSPEDNLLGLTDTVAINEQEAKGLSLAEVYVYKSDTNTLITASLVLEIHRIAFGRLYDWAGKWRTTNVTVGSLQPPDRYQVVHLMYQFLDNLNYKLSETKIGMNTWSVYCMRIMNLSEFIRSTTVTAEPAVC